MMKYNFFIHFQEGGRGMNKKHQSLLLIKHLRFFVMVVMAAGLSQLLVLLYRK